VELVRSGRIGNLRRVEIGLPIDPTAPDNPPEPIPAGLNYDMWLGPTAEAYYTEQRVHPQGMDRNGVDVDINSRPGWLRNENYSLGMITGWGAHHFDTAHWGMNMELTGPSKIEGKGEFPTNKIWNVHGAYHIELEYPGKVIMTVSDKLPNGIKFIGDEGWIWVSRGSEAATSSDPAAKPTMLKPLDASNEKLLDPGRRHRAHDAERVASQELAGVCEVARNTARACAGRTSRQRGVHPELDRHEDGSSAHVGRQGGEVHQRRRGEFDAHATGARQVRRVEARREVRVTLMRRLLACAGLVCLAQAVAPRVARAEWVRDSVSVSWKSNGATLWRFSFDPASGKPFFNPIALRGNPSFTNFKPEDHPWHYGLWFSWKYINHVNYWEEDRTSGHAAGSTRWSTPVIANSA
jgi:hypothetical protein